MSSSVLFHTQGISGITFKRWTWGNGEARASISQQERRLKCSSCKSPKVTATPVSQRRIQGVKMGRLPFFLEVDMHRLKCHECGAFRMEDLSFISSSHAKITRQLERGIIELREQLSISAVARYFQLDWKTVKAVEKTYLKRKYRTIPLADVTVLGVDEIYVGHKKYKTVVRDLLSGAVLHVGDGKGAEALKQFERRLASSKAKIRAVAMDMSCGYTAWVRKIFPDATVVYDHFHLIKLMNEKVDKVRRRTVSQLEKEQRQALKKTISVPEKPGRFARRRPSGAKETM